MTDPTTEATPDSTPGATPDSTPGATPDPTTGATSDSTPGATPHLETEATPHPAFDPMAVRLVRFQRPTTALPYLAGADETRVAALFGLDAPAYRALLDDFERQTRQAAETLLARTDFADAVDRLPLNDSPHIVAIGESTTADRLSWFEILRHAVTLRRPADAVRFTNLAVSGCTTTQALSYTPALAFQRPDMVLCMLGGNDAQHPAPGAPTQVGLPETQRNLALLHDLARQRGPVRWTWLTPSAVDESRVAEYPHFRRAGISWANKDIDEIAEYLLDRPEPTVDTRFDASAEGLYLDDGVHLDIAGQCEVVTAVVHAMAGAA
ncbi:MULTISPECIES: SGNH/GDSL hydrolase family protein [Nonomuraea]|uniref:SGNH/GDSL hydrolase family protein n=1 Tax=Nonomuraea mangrovi TaxID=2316207 RepID=A0ABW4T6Y1_9ACTN